MGNPSCFYDLSEEILTLMSSALIHLSATVLTDLKSLRLTSVRFAYLTIVRTTLFEEIKLTPLPEQFGLFSRDNPTSIATSIAPFVKTVNFEAPPSWTLTLDEFIEIIIAQTIQGFTYDGDEVNFGLYEISSDSNKKFLEDHRGGKFPISQNDLEVAFRNYHTRAEASRELLGCRDLSETWSAVLSRFRLASHGHRVRFTTPNFHDGGCEHLPGKPDCVIRPHDHDEDHPEQVCRRAAAPAGDELYRIGLCCLSHAVLAPKQLDIACAMTGNFESMDEMRLYTGCLGQLQSFIFQPQIQCFNEYFDAFSNHNAKVIADHAADFIGIILRECCGTLETFCYETTCPMHWPGEEVIHLPKLKSLTLGGGLDSYIQMENFGYWMSSMISLEQLRLHDWLYPDVPDEAMDSWRHFFDAIRHHPRYLFIDLNHTMESCSRYLTLQYRTDDFQTYLDQKEDPGLWANVHRSLALYMSGQTDWDETLQSWFHVI